MEDIRLLPCSIGTREMHSDLPEEDDSKYYIRILASNAELDRHHSIMDPKTTLKNFEADAKSELGCGIEGPSWRLFSVFRVRAFCGCKTHRQE